MDPKQELTESWEFLQEQLEEHFGSKPHTPKEAAKFLRCLNTMSAFVSGVDIQIQEGKDA